MLQILGFETRLGTSETLGYVADQWEEQKVDMNDGVITYTRVHKQLVNMASSLERVTAQTSLMEADKAVLDFDPCGCQHNEVVLHVTAN